MNDRYAVAGNPLAHSLSPRIHAEFARQTGQELEYGRLLVDAGCFAAVAKDFFAGGGRGLNVTVPCKNDACRFAGRLTARAALARSVNTLWIDADGTVHGDNTDGIGLVTDLRNALGWPLSGQRVLVLGAGGAAQGILGPILDQNPALVVVANRTPERADALVDQFAKAGIKLASGRLADLRGPYDLIIHATSAGLDGILPDLPDGLATPQTRVYDLFYADRPTPFLSWARKQGATARSDGLGMVIEQAAAAFRIWRGIAPDTEALRQLLRPAGMQH